MKLRLTILLPAAALSLLSPQMSRAGDATSEMTISLDQPGPVISRDIFGQFAEHLGEGIYGGVWVGRSSKIPNVRGIRSDVVTALRALKVPNVRWPGGCFADEYDWRSGIGPERARKSTVNGNWGNVVEPNTFGTHEFMDFVDQIGSEAYVNVNLGTGSPREVAEWLEYMTTPLPSTLGRERVANGRKEPFKIKFLGIGNESWGCGGNMSADAYVERLKLYSTFVRNLNPAQGRANRYVPGPNETIRVAVGPEDEKTEYTEAVMKEWKASSRPWRWGFEALSLHHYTMGRTPMSSPATGFSERDYAEFVKQTLEMGPLIERHSTVMDKYDPQKKVALAVDEWGVWLAPLPNTNPRFLKQQNSLRDAILGALNLNIFVRHADRVRMANVAQMVNVLQSMILTDGNRMVLTPTYHLFRMYVPFQDARSLPVTIKTGTYRNGAVETPQIDAIAARAPDGTVWLALTNIDPNTSTEVAVSTGEQRWSGAVGEVLTAENVAAVNDFSDPTHVAPKTYSVRFEGGAVRLPLAAKSVTVVRLQP